MLCKMGLPMTLKKTKTPGIYSYVLKDGTARYAVSFRDPSHKQVLKRGFTTIRDAKNYRSKKSVEIQDNRYIAPKNLRQKIGELGEDWLQHKETHTKPSTYQTYRSRWITHVRPRWGHIELGKVTVKDVQQWIDDLSRGTASTATRPLSASLIADCHGVLVGVLDTAALNGDLPVNPIKNKVKLPRRELTVRRYLTPEQVKTLADASTHPEIIYTLVYTGMRWGELTALRVRNIDFTKRRINVNSTITQLRDNRRYSENAPKTWEMRSIPYPASLEPILKQQCERKMGEDFVFMSPNGGHLNPPSSQTGWFSVALRKAGLPHMAVHDLRHTTASIAIYSGANIKVVQRLLGHKSAAMTLDVYADLFDDDLDNVAASMENVIRL